MSIFKKNNYIEITDVDTILNKLDDNYKISYEEFTNFYNVFSKEELDVDKKTLFASFLAHSEVDAARNKVFDITDKKMELYSYLMNNLDNIKDETTKEISKHIAKTKEQKDKDKLLYGDKRTPKEVIRDITGDLKSTNKRHK